MGSSQGGAARPEDADARSPFRGGGGISAPAGSADASPSMRDRVESGEGEPLEVDADDYSEEQHEEIFDVRLLLWEDREEQRLEDLRAAAERLGRMDPGEFGAAIARAEAAGVARWKVEAARRLHGRLLRPRAGGSRSGGSVSKTHAAPLFQSPWRCFQVSCGPDVQSAHVWVL